MNAEEVVAVRGDARHRKVSLRDVAGAVVSVVSLAAVVWWARGQQRPHFPSQPADWAELAAAMAVYAVAMLLRGWRWHTILRHARISHRRRDAYAFVVVGYMGNTVLPARGGEIVRTLLMAERSDGKRREILGSIISERLLDAITLLVLFVGMTFAGVAPSGLGRSLAAICALAGVIVVVAAFAILRVRRTGRLERFAAATRPFLRTSRPLFGAAGAVLASTTMLVWALEATVFWLVAQSVNIDITFVQGAFVVVLTSFVISIPAAPGYIGTFDAALLFGLGGYAVHGGQTIAFALLWRFVLFVPITIAGLILVFVGYGGLSRLRGRTT